MRQRLRLGGGLGEDFGLALGVVGLLALLGGGSIYAVIPELRGWALALLGAGALGILAFAILGRSLIGQFLATRQGRYGLNTALMIIAFGGILVLANVLSVNFNARVDVTATRQFTLASQTERVLRGLTQPVVAYGFFTPDDPAVAAAAGLLREYSLVGNNFDFEIVDPETDPAKASRFQIDQYGLVIFSSGDRITRTNNLTEQAFTAALLRATGQGLKTVCFISGHGERSILGTTDLGLAGAAQALERELYVVRDFGFFTPGGVPEECAVVVVAGPDRDLEVSEETDEGALFRDYLGGGGNVLFLLTPETPDTWLRILREGGVEAGGGAVVDPASYAQPDRTTPFIRPDQYLSQPLHPITDPLIERSLGTFFPLTTRVAPLPPEEMLIPGAAFIIPLMFTSERSWLESDIQNVDTATYDQSTDKRGPLSIAVAVEFPTLTATGQPDSGRFVAIGNTAFAGNQFFFSLGNGDLFINSVNWLTEQEDLISIRPKLSAPRLLILSQRQASWILYSSVGVLPLVVGFFGGWVWWRRR